MRNQLVFWQFFFGFKLLVAIKQTSCLQPTGQCTLTSEILHLTFSSCLAWGKNYYVNFIYKFLAICTVGIIVVVDRLKQGIALLVKVFACNHFILVYQRLGNLQILCEYLFYNHCYIYIIRKVTLYFCFSSTTSQ